MPDAQRRAVDFVVRFGRRVLVECLDLAAGRFGLGLARPCPKAAAIRGQDLQAEHMAWESCPEPVEKSSRVAVGGLELLVRFGPLFRERLERRALLEIAMRPSDGDPAGKRGGGAAVGTGVSGHEKGTKSTKAPRKKSSGPALRKKPTALGSSGVPPGSNLHRLLGDRLSRNLSCTKPPGAVVHFAFMGLHNGGVVVDLSPGQRELFLKAYADDLLAGDAPGKQPFRIGISETRGSTFPMFVDLDLKIPAILVDKDEPPEPVLDDDEFEEEGEDDGADVEEPQPTEEVAQPGRTYRSVDTVFLRLALGAMHMAVIGAVGNQPEFGKHGLCMYVAETEPRLYRRRGLWTKVGLHIYWPKLVVDSERALVLRHAMIVQLRDHHELKRRTRALKYGIKWENLLDPHPYGDGGALRPLWARKLEPCPACTSEHRLEECGFGCKADKNGVRNVTIAPYKLKTAFDGHRERNDELVKKLEGKHYKALKMLSLRRYGPDGGLADLTPFDVEGLARKIGYDLDSRLTNRRGFEIQKSGERDAVLAEDETRIAGDFEVLPEDMGKIVDELRIFLTKSYAFSCPPWTLKSVRRKWAVVPGLSVMDVTYYAFTDCRFCMNLGACHSKRCTYFEITVSGVAQRCLCKCDTTANRRFGKCSEYRSARDVQLPPDLAEVLFVSSQDGMYDLALSKAALELRRLSQAFVHVCELGNFAQLKAQKNARAGKRRRVDLTSEPAPTYTVGRRTENNDEAQ